MKSGKKEIGPVKVLIFSVSIGAGHDSVANALSERLKYDVPGSEIRIVDTFQYINVVLHKVVQGSYMETIRFTPKVWGLLYEQVEEGERLIDMGQILSKLLSPKLEHLLNEFGPHVIIATHAFPTGILAMLKRKGHITVPLASVVTDFHVHAFWVHEGVDRYFLPAPDLDYRLKKSGVKGEQIKVSGIPIRLQFSEKIDRDKERENLSLSNKPIALVMGGGLGLGRIELIAKELLENSDFQVVVVAGKNKRLLGILSDIDDPRLQVFGFVDNVAQIMAAADIIISKPGGVTIAEILAMKKPLFIYSSLPGQEDRNTDYLLNRGAAVKIKKIGKLVSEIESFWENPIRRRHVQEMAEYLGSPHAGELVWEEMLALTENQNVLS